MFYNGQRAQDKVFLSPQLFSSSFFTRLSAHNLMSCNSICKRGVHATIESLRNNLQRAMGAIATSWFDSVHLKASLLAVSVLINLFLIRLPSQWSPSAKSMERTTFPMTLCALSKLTFFRFHFHTKNFSPHRALCLTCWLEIIVRRAVNLRRPDFQVKTFDARCEATWRRQQQVINGFGEEELFQLGGEPNR